MNSFDTDKPLDEQGPAEQGDAAFTAASALRKPEMTWTKRQRRVIARFVENLVEVGPGELDYHNLRDKMNL